MARPSSFPHALRPGALWSALVLAVTLLGSSPALAQLEPPPAAAEGRCQTPRQALYTVLYWLQPERLDRHKAAACLDRSGLAERSDPEQAAAERAVALKLALDASGIWVRWEDIPDDPDHRDARGDHRFELYPERIPGLAIERTAGRWLFSRASLDQVAPFVVATSPESGEGSLAAAMPDWLRGDVFGVEVWQLIGLLVLIIIGMVLRRLVIYGVVTWVRRVTRRLTLGWLDQVVVKADRPLGTLVLAGLIAVGLPLLALPDRLAFIVAIAIRSLAAFSVVWLCYRLVDVISDAMQARAEKTESKLDDQLVPLIRKSLKVFFVVVGALFILQNLDIDVGSLLAGLGLGGLAFALAAKDTVANFFGSVMIFIDKPFQIGDWIKMGSDIEGTVEEVGFRTSRIRTFYNSVITVPNANVTNTPVDNLGAREYRRYRTMLGLTYDTPPEKIEAFCEGLRGLLLSLPHIRRDYFFVEFQTFGPHSLDIMLYCFFAVPDWKTELRARTLLNLNILKLAQALSVEFAFPTQSLHLASTPERPLAQPARPDPAALARVVTTFGPDGAEARRDGFGLAERFTPRAG